MKDLTELWESIRDQCEGARIPFSAEAFSRFTEHAKSLKLVPFRGPFWERDAFRAFFAFRRLEKEDRIRQEPD